MPELVFPVAGDQKNVPLALENLDLAGCRYRVAPSDTPGRLQSIFFPERTADPPPIPEPGGIITLDAETCARIRAEMPKARVEFRKRRNVTWRRRWDTCGVGQFFEGSTSLRSEVVSLVRAYCGGSLGDPKFEEVTQGRAGEKGYSACGDLWNFVLYRAGCRDPSIVNRDEPSAGLKWHVAENLSRPVGGSQKVKAWVPATSANPRPGDLVLIGTYPEEIQHANVFLAASGATWEVGEYGRVDKNGKPSSAIGHPVRSGMLLGQRHIIGWIDIEKVPKVAGLTGVAGGGGGLSWALPVILALGAILVLPKVLRNAA